MTILGIGLIGTEQEDERKAREIENIKHLMALARRGKERTGASNAERQAYALVRAVLQNIPGLDGPARAGLAQLIEMTARAPMETSDVVRDALSPRRSIAPVRARIAEVK